jgi:hypothetical protein
LSVYFADGLNPDRYLNVGDPRTWPASDAVWAGAGANINYYLYPNGSKELWPGVFWNEICTDSNGVEQTSPGVWPTGHPVAGCINCENINTLNCYQLRI